MPIPNFEQAVVEEQKLRDYLLNTEHPDGGSKARWLRSLGYAPDNWQTLADHIGKSPLNVLRSIPNTTALV